MSSDDLDDIKAGLNSLRKAMQSIRDALSAVDRMRDSNDKRDAEIALVIDEQLREARKPAVDAHGDAPAEDLEPDVD